MEFLSKDQTCSDTECILIAEDNEITLSAIQLILEDEGYQTIGVSNGEAALEAVEKFSVDLVLLDRMLPDMDGLVVSRKLKADTDYAVFLPVILLTALSSGDDKIAGLTCADDYVTKPFCNDELVARVRSLLRIRKLHKQLIRSQNRYKFLYERFPHLFITLDSGERITECNQAFCSCTGVSKEIVLGSDVISYIRESDHPSFYDFLKSLEEEKLQIRSLSVQLRAEHGRTADVEVKGVSLDEQDQGASFILSMEDVTEKLRVEEERKIARKQLYRSARLASIGVLASGVAHEVNNPLTAILGFAGAILDRLKHNESIEQEELSQYLQIINDEALRCRDIVENLSRFARGGDLAISVVSLSTCINNALKLIHAKAVRAGFTFETDVDANLKVMADANKLEQAIVNVFTNCIDFCPGGCTVKVNAALSPLGKSVVLKIVDQGPGISAEVLPRVFDPFFSTKEVGKGIGMGLSICYNIMEECNGKIDVISETRSKGTTVVLEIPKACGSYK